jgi:hypothetical protein
LALPAYTAGAALADAGIPRNLVGLHFALPGSSLWLRNSVTPAVLKITEVKRENLFHSKLRDLDLTIIFVVWDLVDLRESQPMATGITI